MIAKLAEGVLGTAGKIITGKQDAKMQREQNATNLAMAALQARNQPAPAPKTDNKNLYIGLGIGGFVLVVIVLVVVLKRKSA